MLRRHDEETQRGKYSRARNENNYSQLGVQFLILLVSKGLTGSLRELDKYLWSLHGVKEPNLYLSDKT